MSDLRDRMIPLRTAVDAATEAAIGAMTRDLAPTQRGAPLASLAPPAHPRPFPVSPGCSQQDWASGRHPVA